MKNIIINTDGDRMVYSVPSAVADNLEKYCLDLAAIGFGPVPSPKNTERATGSVIMKRISLNI